MTASTDLSRIEIPWHGYSWLDKHIIEQANHYKTSPEKLSNVMGGAAEYCEMIEQGVVDEPITQRKDCNA